MKSLLTTNLYCLTFGHNYVRINKSANNAILVCKCCKKQFVSKVTGEILELSSDPSHMPRLVEYL